MALERSILSMKRQAAVCWQGALVRPQARRLTSDSTKEMDGFAASRASATLADPPSIRIKDMRVRKFGLDINVIPV